MTISLAGTRVLPLNAECLTTSWPHGLTAVHSSLVHHGLGTLTLLMEQPLLNRLSSPPLLMAILFIPFYSLPRARCSCVDEDSVILSTTFWPSFSWPCIQFKSLAHVPRKHSHQMLVSFCTLRLISILDDLSVHWVWPDDFQLLNPMAHPSGAQS